MKVSLPTNAALINCKTFQENVLTLSIILIFKNVIGPKKQFSEAGW